MVHRYADALRVGAAHTVTCLQLSGPRAAGEHGEGTLSLAAPDQVISIADSSAFREWADEPVDEGGQRQKGFSVSQVGQGNGTM